MWLLLNAQIKRTALVGVAWIVTLALLAACHPTAAPTTSLTAVASPEPIWTPTRTAMITPEPSSTSVATPTVVPTPRPSHMPTSIPFVPQPPNDNTYGPHISADGRYIAFVSWADNLVEGDTNERPDVFVYDRYTGQIMRVSTASDGTQSDGVSGAPAISAYGRWIAFASEARSLAPNQTDWEWNVFIHEPQTGQTEQITQYASNSPSLSADGRYVALVGTRHIYVHDRQTGQSERITTGANGESISPAISADGRYVTFWSWAGNLVDDDEQDCEQAGAPLSCGDVFVYDRQARTMERIPVGEGYGLGGGGYELSISADGRWVVFRGILYDRQTKTQSSFCSLGTDVQSAAQTSVMSADGRWIAFSDGQVYLCDRVSGTITPISTAPDGTPGDGPSGIAYGHEGHSGDLALSADGRWLVFTSQASNLIPGRAKDSRCQRPLAVVPGVPHCYDVYLYDRETRTMSQLGHPGSVTAIPAPVPTPLPEIAALAAYVPVTDDAGPVMETLFVAIARWLADGVPTTEIAARLGAALPEGNETATVEQVDLTGDGLDDMAVHIPLMGLPLLVLVQQETPGTTYTHYLLPPDLEAIRLGWSHSLTAVDHGVDQTALQIIDLTGDGVTDLIITHGYAGASNLRLSPRAYQWHEGDFQLVFAAELTSWAGYSTLHLESDPDGGRVIRLAYQVFLPGRAPTVDPNPRGEQFWRWNQDAGRYQLAWQIVGPAPLAAPSADLTRAEAALLHGAYGDAVAHYEAFLADQAWQDAYMRPYTTIDGAQRAGERGLAAWLDYARLRRGIALALSGHPAEAQAALAKVCATEALADLAKAFLEAYKPSGDAIAGLAAYERRRAVGPTCRPANNFSPPVDCPEAVTYRAFLPEPLLVLAALTEFGMDNLAAVLTEYNTPVSDVTVNDLDGDGTEEVLWIGAPPWQVYGAYNLPHSDWQQAWVAWQGDEGWQATGIAAADQIESLQILPTDTQGRSEIQLTMIHPEQAPQTITLLWDGAVNRPLVVGQPAGWPDVGWPNR